MTTRTKLILGIIGAAAAGAAIGMLLAPEKGTDLRRNISSKAGDWASSVGDLFASAKDGYSNLKERGAKAASDLADRYTRKAENFS